MTCKYIIVEKMKEEGREIETNAEIVKKRKRYKLRAFETRVMKIG